MPGASSRKSKLLRPCCSKVSLPIRIYNFADTYMDRVEVACSIANDTQTLWWGHLVKPAPEVACFGISGDLADNLGIHQGIVDGL